MKPLLSVCLIVKDEEKVLRRCLESVNGIADEIIIADTGSSDKSKEIAIEFTNKVYDYKWEDDFSKARNFAASKASGEWILALDADEYVDRYSFTSFKNSLMGIPSEINILAVEIVNFVGTNGKDTLIHKHERIYKNDGSISYYRNIHEELKHKQSLEKRGVAQLQLFHSGYMDNVVKDKNKSKRNLTLLTNKKNKDAIDYFYLANEYGQMGDMDKAIKHYQKAYQLKGNIHYEWVKMLLVRLIDCLHIANRKKDALIIINESEKIFNNVVDFKFLKGQFYKNDGEENEAIRIFEEILLNKEKLSAVSSKDYLDYLPHKYLGELYEKNNQLQLAVLNYSKCLSINDADDYAWMRLINLLAKHSSMEELVQFINNNCLNRRTMATSRLVKILLTVPILDVQKLTQSYLNKSELSEVEETALILKILFLDGNYQEILEIIKSKDSNEISLVLSKGIFSIIDLILLAIETNIERIRTVLLEIKVDQPINNLLKLLFGLKNKKLSTIEEDIFITLFKQAAIMHSDKMKKYLKNKQNNLSMDGKKKLQIEIKTYDLL